MFDESSVEDVHKSRAIIILRFFLDLTLLLIAMKQGGDDLGDDFVVDDLVALSGEEDAAFDGGLLSDSGEAHDAISGEEDNGDRNPQQTTAAVTERKRKRREKEKERKAKVRGPLRASYVQLIASDYVQLETKADRECRTD
jgi:hypothetical protein